MPALRLSRAAVVLGCLAPLVLSAQTPNLGVTKTGTFTPGANGRATPGAEIRYNNVIANSGTGTAPAVTYTDATPPNTTLVPGSVNVSPVAINDTFAAVGNTLLRAGGSPGAGPEVYSATGVSGNDREFLGDTSTVTRVQAVTAIVAGTITATTAQSGTVVMKVADGSFTYLPAKGFTGSDSFTYQIKDDGTDLIAGNADDLSDSATVTLTVGGMVWYVDGALATNGDGRSTSPFNTLTSVNGSSDADAPGQTLCIYPFSYTGGLLLENDQVLLGRSHGFFSGTTPLLAAGGSNPTIAGGLALASGNTVQGINLGNATTAALSGGTVGIAKVNNVTAGTISNTGGPAVAITGSGALTMAFSSLTSTNSNATGISLTNCTGTFSAAAGSIGNATGTDILLSGGSLDFTFNGTVNDDIGQLVSITGQSGGLKDFNGLITDGNDGDGSGITLTGNTGATIRFDGGLILSTGSNNAFTATGGGTVVITDPATEDNLITTTTAAALRFAATNIGTGGLVFRSISSNGGDSVGISLDSTGSAGGLTVTGDGGTARNASGGTIRSKTGADGNNAAGTGIYLNNTAGVSLNQMQLNDFQNHAVFGTAVSGFRLTNSTVNGIIGTNSAATDAAIAFGLLGQTNGLTGTALIDNVEIAGAIEHSLEFYQQLGSVNLTVTNCNIHDNSTASGGDGIQMEFRGTSTATVVVSNNLLSNNKSQAVQISTVENAVVSATLNLNNVLRSTQGFEGLVFSNGGDSRLTAFLTNNTISGIPGAGIFVGQVPGNASSLSDLRATITGNTLTAPTSATNHALIAYLSSTSGQISKARLLIDANTIIQNSTGGTSRGIVVDAPDASRTPDYHATVTNNKVEINDPVGGVAGISVQARNGAIGHFDVRGNDVDFDNGTPAGILGLRVRQATLAVAELERGSSASNTASVVLAANNPLSTSEILGTVTVVENTVVRLPSEALLFAPAAEAPALAEMAPVVSEIKVMVPAPAPQSATALSQATLDTLVAAALSRWETSGLTAEQMTVLRGLHFELADLPGLHLGCASGHHIRISPRAAGQDWFIDSTPLEDGEFSGPSLASVDLLTTLMHEMGHALGLPDRYDLADKSDIMYGYLSHGERRLPAKGAASSAKPFNDVTPRFLAAPILIGDLPPGKSVTVVYAVTINSATAATSISSTGAASGVASNTVVTPVEQPAAVSNIALGVAEDVVLGFAANSFDSGYSDGNDDTLVSVRITTLPSNGVLKLSGTDLTGPVDILRANLPNLTFVPAADFNGGTSFGWTGSDGVAFASPAALVNIAVSAVNDLPTLDAVSNPAAILEDSLAQTVNLTGIGAGGGETQALTVTAVSGNTALLANPVVTYTSPEATATLSYTPVANQSGSAVVTVTVTDDASASVQRTFTVNVAAVNDAPTLAAIADPAALPVGSSQQTLALTGISEGPLESAQTLTITAVSGNPSLVPNPSVSFTEGNATGSLSFTPAAGQSGSALVTVTVSDNGGVLNGGIDSVQQTFTVTVFPSYSIVADATTTAEGSGSGTTAATFTVARTGSTTAAVTLDYAVTGAANAADFGGSLPAGSITIPAGQSAATLTVNVSKDDTVELDENFTVTLTDPNNGVISQASAAGSIVNDDSSTISLTGASVAEGDSASALLVFTVSLTNPVDIAVTVDRQSLVTGSATEGVDFTGLSSASLSIPAGETTANFAVTVIGDNDVEPDETVDASVSNLAAAGRNVTPGSASATGTILTDDPLLVAAAGSLTVKTGTSGKLKISALLALTSPVEGRPVSLVSVQNPSSAAAVVTIAEGWISYQPPAGYTGLDSFNYTITDGVQTVSGAVAVSISQETGATPNVYRLTDEGEGKRLLSLGIPGRTYQLQTSPDVTVWTSQGAPVLCPPAGAMSFFDPGPLPPTRFYRVVETAAP